MVSVFRVVFQTNNPLKKLSSLLYEEIGLSNSKNVQHFHWAALIMHFLCTRNHSVFFFFLPCSSVTLATSSFCSWVFSAAVGCYLLLIVHMMDAFIVGVCAFFFFRLWKSFFQTHFFEFEYIRTVCEIIAFDSNCIPAVSDRFSFPFRFAGFVIRFYGDYCEFVRRSRG